MHRASRPPFLCCSGDYPGLTAENGLGDSGGYCRVVSSSRSSYATSGIDRAFTSASHRELAERVDYSLSGGSRCSRSAPNLLNPQHTIEGTIVSGTRVLLYDDPNIYTIESSDHLISDRWVTFRDANKNPLAQFAVPAIKAIIIGEYTEAMNV